MRRKGVLTAVWLLATVAATLVAWAAVRQVTAEVSPSRTLPFPSGVALADGATAPAAPTQASDAPATEAPPRPRRSDGPAAPASDRPVAAAEEPPANGDREEPEDDEPAPAAPVTTEAYNLTGGVVTVRYRGSAVTLVSATPNSGFGVDINDAGPGKVDVRFRAEEHESRLVTRVRDGVPDPQREERPR